MTRGTSAESDAFVFPPEERPRVVIVGGGFGGTHAAHALRHAPVQVTVIDRTNHSIFHPLLYEVACAGLSSDEIAVPIRFLLRRLSAYVTYQRGVRILTPDDQRDTDHLRRAPSAAQHTT